MNNKKEEYSKMQHRRMLTEIADCVNLHVNIFILPKSTAVPPSYCDSNVMIKHLRVGAFHSSTLHQAQSYSEECAEITYLNRGPNLF